MVCLYFGNKTGKDLADIPLVLRIHRVGEFVCGTIPRYYAPLLMRKQTHGLPTIGQQDVAGKNLLNGKAIGRLDGLDGMGRQRRH